MSTNFVSYENAEDILQGYADRIKANTEFVGTQAEWDALSAEDKAKYVLVNITDDNSSTGGEKEVINGYYNSADGKFYIDSSYTTEIIPDSACIYVDLNENKMYRYDSLTSQYVVMSGGGGKVYVGGYGINVDNTTDEISAKTFVGTQAEWNALSPEAQEEFDSVNITDDATPIDYEPGHAIVDSTGTEAPQRSNLKFDGMTVTDNSTDDTTVVAPIPYTAGDKITITDHEISVDETVTTTFTGTRAEWEALSATEKAAYNIVNLTDDPAGSGMVVVDVVQDGNMNAVTSNAVYDVFFMMRPDLWAFNTEYSFGNNLYGKRWTGACPTSSSVNPDEIAGITNIVSYGGSVIMGPQKNIHTYPYTPSNPDVWGTNLYYSTNNHKIYMWFGSGYKSDNTYDVWLLYKK